VFSYSSLTAPTKPSGRPKGAVTKKPASLAPAPAEKVRAYVSLEVNARIAAAQSARWAALKKISNVAKPAAKKTSVKRSRKTVTSVKKAIAA
jgi:hypothetical protein